MENKMIMSKKAFVSVAVINAIFSTLFSSDAIAQENTVDNDNTAIVIDSIDSGNNYGSSIRNFVADNSFSIVDGITINQGDFIVSPSGFCTVGYVNPEKKQAIFAGHCADKTYKDGSKPKRYDVRVAGGIRVGTVIDNNYNSESGFANDIALIQFDKWVNVGTNEYSGDSWVKIEDVAKGDKLCSYGTRTKRIRCGEVDSTRPEDNIIIGNIETTGNKGDSGGPAWVEGKGFVGVYSYSQTINDKRVAGGFVQPTKYMEQIAPAKGSTNFSDSIGKTHNLSSQMSSITKNNEYLIGYIGIIAFIFGSAALGSMIFNSWVKSFSE